MPIINVSNPTLLDLATRSDPNGKIQLIAEILNQTNEVVPDMTFIEGNLPTGHKTTIRSGLPVAVWRKFYGGVPPSKSSTAQITDNCGMLEAYSQIDKALADLNGNTNEYRMSESTAYIESMGQELASAIFYANDATTPEKFLGLAPRFNSLSAENADNIIDAGGVGADNNSIWLVVWGKDLTHGIIPKGSKAGLQVTDKGQVTLENVDGNGGMMEAYRMHFRLDAGLTVRDWRYVVRIANIDKSTLTPDISTGADLFDLMAQAEELVPNLSKGKAVWYMSRQMRTMLRRQGTNKIKGSTLESSKVNGQLITQVNEIPVRRVDVLAGDEARVV